MKYIPPQAAVPQAVKDLAAHGIKVELYDRNNEKLKAYYVGGMTSNERGTYMIMEEAEQPYVMHIPSWEGGLRVRYWLSDMDWEDRTIFGYKPEEINSVSVEYPRQKNKSFKLEQKGGEYLVEPYYEITPRINQSPVKGVAEAYLIGFKSQQFCHC